MKKNRIIGLSLVLLFLIVIYASTYAYYMRVVNGTISANTGAFTFDVLHNNATFKEINLYDTMDSPSVVSSDKVIVPGDKGKFDLVAKATNSSVDIEYTIGFSTTNMPSNMKFYLDENKTKVLDIETNTINGFLDVSSTSSKTHTIYWEWPYDSGRYNDLDIEYANKSFTINVTTVGKQSKDGIMVYGIKRDTNSTSTAWERIEDSIGLEANAILPESGTSTTANTTVKNDFDNIYPWSDIKSYNYNANTRKVTAWYGDSNFKFDGSNGEVLTYIPGFYYKREVVNGVEYQYISKYEQDGYSYSEPFSVGRYKISRASSLSNTSSNNEGKIELMSTQSGNRDISYFDINTENISSRSGAKPLTYQKIGYFREYASKLGSDFSIMDYHWYVLQMLYLVEYADYDSQTKLGIGVTNDSSNLGAILGGTDELGMQSGCLVNDGAHSMIYRGIEDIYGNTLDFLDGINIKDGQAYINYDFKTYWSDTFDGNYKALGYVNANGGGYYITKLGYDSNNPLIGLPTEIDTTNTDRNNPTGIKDGYYSGGTILVVGGAYINSAGAGLWLSDAYVGSHNYGANVGSRLIRHQTSGGRGVTNPQEGSSSGAK